MTGISLFQMVDEYKQALSGLAELEIDDQTLADTLEGLTGEVTIKAQNVAAFALNLEAEAEAIKAVEKRLADRRRAYENKAKKMRDYLLFNMQNAGITEISALDRSFRIRVMAGRDSVVIDDPASLPVDYKRVKTIEEPDKILIGKAIKDGYEVPGAHVERKPSLKID